MFLELQLRFGIDYDISKTIQGDNWGFLSQIYEVSGLEIIHKWV
jgi:hypothetical protein